MAEDVELGNPRKRVKLDSSIELSHEFDNSSQENDTFSAIRLDETELDGRRNEEDGGTDDAVLDSSLEQQGDFTSDSDTSDLSSISGLSEEAWKVTSGPMSWVQRMISNDQDPRAILENLLPDENLHDITESMPDIMLWKLIISILSEPPKREKLPHINTLDDVVQLMSTCSKILVLTGAGVSVSCGIPDFRSRDGVYARLAVDFPDLPDPQAMFDIRYFRNDQRPFFKFAKEIYPGQFEPSRCHKFIRLIEQNNKLLRNYTQNIDTLEQVAGIHNVIQCHGSFATATCMECGNKVDAEYVKEDIMNQVIPLCPKCSPEPDTMKLQVLKPDIVFFGESLPEHFHNQMAADKHVCDLLIVIGSSLKVRPVALIPNSLPPSIPQILINREPLKHMNFDVELLGDCDVIVNELCRRLGGDWVLPGNQPPVLQEVRREELATPPISPQRLIIPKHDECQEKPQEECQQGSDGDESEERLKPTTSKSPDDNSDEMQESSGKSSLRDKAKEEDSVDDQCKEAISSYITMNKKHNESVSEQTGARCDSSTDACENVIKDSRAVNTDFVKEVELDTGGDNSSTEHETTAVSVKKWLDGGATDSGSRPGEAEPKVAWNEPQGKAGKAADTQESSADTAESTTEPDQEADSSAEHLHQLRQMWRPKWNIAKGLENDQYLFVPPCRYVFHGAEVYEYVDNSEDEDDSNSLKDGETSILPDKKTIESVLARSSFTPTDERNAVSDETVQSEKTVHIRRDCPSVDVSIDSEQSDQVVTSSAVDIDDALSETPQQKTHESAVTEDIHS